MKVELLKYARKQLRIFYKESGYSIHEPNYLNKNHYKRGKYKLVFYLFNFIPFTQDVYETKEEARLGFLRWLHIVYMKYSRKYKENKRLQKIKSKEKRIFL